LPGPSRKPRRRKIRPLLGLSRAFNRFTGNPVETDLTPYREIVEEIKARDYSRAPDAELSGRARAARLVSGAEAEVEIFALAREASRRALGLDPFDVQLISGLAMARGRVAELPTGEGKTLAAVFPASLAALAGRGAHVLTFNDYLARRDAAWMGPLYERLGLTVACVQEGMGPAAKRAAYLADVTYATAKEAGFDFLRDRIAEGPEALVHRPFHFAVVDEADSILVDEARIPLVISGADERASWDAARLAALVRRLAPGRDYETDDEHRNVFLTEAGARRVEAAFGVPELYAADQQRLLEAVYCALHAEALLRRDIDYIVRGGRLEIVDEFTGRVVDKRHFPDGLQAAAEAKEGLARRTEGRVLGSITLQHFFRLYPRLCGMTATARSAAHEFGEFYGLPVVIVPPHVPSIRDDRPDAVFTHREAKRKALVAEIAGLHASGRPVLVGTASVRESEDLAAELRAAGVELEVLNARNDEKEAAVIAEAGRPGAVTISTNMAGRGTDIKLGGADERERVRAAASGGLFVIGTNRHESLRIDRQLRGRAGRQGDPGATRFFISLEDDLFERYGLAKMFRRRRDLARREEALPAGPIQREIAHAQRIIEGQSFDIRRTLNKYSELIEVQRRVVQARRDEVLLGSAGAAGDDAPEAAAAGLHTEKEFLPEGLFAAREPELHERGVKIFGAARLAELERRASLHHIDRAWSDHLAWVQDTRESIHLVSLGGETPLHKFLRFATDEFEAMRARIADAIVGEMTAWIAKGEVTSADLERLKGPSSTWTYLVNEDQFGWGMDLVMGRNIGFATLATAAFGPLLTLVLIMNKLKRKKKE
jgi:preprotein translocase subunit SecA